MRSGSSRGAHNESSGHKLVEVIRRSSYTGRAGGRGRLLGEWEREFVMVRKGAEQVDLHRFLLRYTQVLNVRTSGTAFTNANHTLEMRLARWLLMCHDRVDGDDIEITHEFMAMMLGVRRAGVTTALHILEGNQLIRSIRGLVTIRDREKLEELADDAYGLPEAEDARLIRWADGAALFPQPEIQGRCAGPCR
jgi:Crp-like helix-turn-helix domain